MVSDRINDGAELKCQYHGWRYANRTAGCTYIPAHPADAPARTICNRTYPSAERYGLVWSGEAPDGELPEVSPLEAGTPIALRGIPVNATPELTLRMLRDYSFQPNGAIDGENAETTVKSVGDDRIFLTSADGDATTSIVIFVQPVDAGRSVTRGVLCTAPSAAAELAVLMHHNQHMSALRERIEDEAAALPMPEPLQPIIHRVSAELAAMPGRASSGRSAPLRVAVTKKWVAADGIAGFELTSVGRGLLTFQPGAHIDVHMPNGMIRQYSIMNGPDEHQCYRIGVKLEPDSRGGSACMHHDVREGDVLAISEPRNNFPLRRDAIRTLLIAGGVGITPLLSMARARDHSDLPFELHYFVQSKEHMAFSPALETLGNSMKPHAGLDPDATGKALEAILEHYEQAMHLYVCGPGPMLDAARTIAAKMNWPEEAVHFEYFKNTNQIDDSSSFEIDLARSVMTLKVPAGKTILEVLRENSVDVPSSCEQGACGTCLLSVIEGEPDHQDVYLSDGEKQSGKCIMACVSRARSSRLILDI